MVKTIELSPGVTLRYFPDNRFKQGALSIQFLRPMCREEAALNALLPDVLLRGCQSAPDMRRITLRLDDLYGASVGALVRRVGDIQTTGLSCSFAAFASLPLNNPATVAAPTHSNILLYFRLPIQRLPYNCYKFVTNL